MGRDSYGPFLGSNGKGGGESDGGVIQESPGVRLRKKGVPLKASKRCAGRDP